MVKIVALKHHKHISYDLYAVFSREQTNDSAQFFAGYLCRLWLFGGSPPVGSEFLIEKSISGIQTTAGTQKNSYMKIRRFFLSTQ